MGTTSVGTSTTTSNLTSPGTGSGNVCSPMTKCNVCSACCNSWIENGPECDECVEHNSKCEPGTTTTIAITTTFTTTTNISMKLENEREAKEAEERQAAEDVEEAENNTKAKEAELKMFQASSASKEQVEKKKEQVEKAKQKEEKLKEVKAKAQKKA